MSGLEGRNFEREAKGSSGTVFDAAMTADMNTASGNVFQIDCIRHLDKVRDKALRRHLTSFLQKPISFKLTNNQAPKRGGNTYRAVVKTSAGEKLRGYWKRGPDQESLRPRDLLELSYDEALRRRGTVGTHVDFEVQLPPLKGFLPSVVYSVVLGTGNSNREASVVKSVGIVKIFPKGLEGKGFNMGRTHVGVPMRSGLVDPSWAKGKKIFRKGRSIGQV